VPLRGESHGEPAGIRGAEVEGGHLPAVKVGPAAAGGAFGGE
jgi:hypothetical protein